MPFTLIQGTFHVAGYSPDGDSIKFMAKNPDNWNNISGKPKLNKKGHTQLRIEAIDALETHYRPRVKGQKLVHQYPPLSIAARDFLIDAVGIKNVVWGPLNSKVVSADDGVNGYILTRTVDNNRYGRPVSFVYAGKPPQKDGSEVYLNAAHVRKSINYKMLKAGLAYPTYYLSLFAEIREEMTKAVKAARTAKVGIWKADATPGFAYVNRDTLTEDACILPKLFRRLMDHIAGGNTLDTFKDYLKAKKDGVLILPKVNHTDALDYIVEVSGNDIAMSVRPENLVFDPQK